MVTGTTRSGIAYEIDERIKDDIRIYRCLSGMRRGDDLSKMDAVFDLLGLIFGGEDGSRAFQDAVASVHDGVCNATDMLSELAEMLEAVGLKN